MSYVYSSVFLCLLPAALLGGLIGYLWYRSVSAKRIGKMESNWASKYGLLEGERDKLKASLSETSGKIPVLETAVAGWVAKSALWDTGKAKLEADLKASADARGKLTADLAALTSDRDQGRAALAALEGESARLRGDLAAATACVTALTDEGGKLKSAVEASAASAASREAELTASRSRTVELEKQGAALRSDLAAARTEIDGGRRR